MFLRMVSVENCLLYKFVSFLAKSKVEQCRNADRWGRIVRDEKVGRESSSKGRIMENPGYII